MSKEKSELNMACNCGKDVKISCPGCNNVQYCSIKCRARLWDNHYKVCSIPIHKDLVKYGYFHYTDIEVDTEGAVVTRSNNPKAKTPESIRLILENMIRYDDPLMLSYLGFINDLDFNDFTALAKAKREGVIINSILPVCSPSFKRRWSTFRDSMAHYRVNLLKRLHREGKIKDYEGLRAYGMRIDWISYEDISRNKRAERKGKLRSNQFSSLGSGKGGMPSKRRGKRGFRPSAVPFVTREMRDNKDCMEVSNWRVRPKK